MNPSIRLIRASGMSRHLRVSIADWIKIRAKAGNKPCGLSFNEMMKEFK